MQHGSYFGNKRACSLRYPHLTSLYPSCCCEADSTGNLSELCDYVFPDIQHKNNRHNPATILAPSWSSLFPSRSWRAFCRHNQSASIVIGVIRTVERCYLVYRNYKKVLTVQRSIYYATLYSVHNRGDARDRDGRVFSFLLPFPAVHRHLLVILEIIIVVLVPRVLFRGSE